ncbi:MAG: right-handed parallel beta-helix repeat-containing protein [Nanoarchaeota archaeon]|nr:right-handed parallel beta-helix repeat-containing protein [Nanoarchaeota archaeon]
MGKRGISDIVAAVLMILITIVAVTIIWGVIIPLIKNNSDFQDPNARLEITTSGGYTFYDDGMLYVQVKRGNDDNIMIGLEIIVTTEGDSRTYKYNSTYAPGPNQAVVIRIWVGTKPDYVKVVPIFISGNTLEKGSESSKAKIDNGKAAPPREKTPTICDDDDDCYNGEICSETKCCGCAAGELEYENGCAINVSSCGINLDEEGRTYLVTQNIETSGTCLIITADDIVLDGNGKTIIGDGVNTYGIYANGRSGLTIKNFKNITCPYYGVYFESTNNLIVRNVTLTSNMYGIYLYLSSNNTLTQITANSNFKGVLLESSSNNTLTQITANSNGHGVCLGPYSNDNQLSDITANSNGDIGIIISYSSSNIFTDIIVNDNSNIGVKLDENSNNNKLFSSNICNSGTENLLCDVAVFFEGSGNTCSLFGTQTICGIECVPCG